MGLTDQIRKQRDFCRCSSSTNRLCICSCMVTLSCHARHRLWHDCQMTMCLCRGRVLTRVLKMYANFAGDNGKQEFYSRKRHGPAGRNLFYWPVYENWDCIGCCAMKGDIVVLCLLSPKDVIPNFCCRAESSFSHELTQISPHWMIHHSSQWNCSLKILKHQINTFFSCTTGTIGTI